MLPKDPWLSAPTSQQVWQVVKKNNFSSVSPEKPFCIDKGIYQAELKYTLYLFHFTYSEKEAEASFPGQTNNC